MLYLGPRRLQLGCSFHFECLLFYCPHLLLFFALSITLGKPARFDSNQVSYPLAKWHNARCGCGPEFTRKRARRPASRLGFVWKGLYFVNGSGLARCRYEQYQASCSYNDKGQGIPWTSEHDDYWNASWILELINCEFGLSLNLGSASGGAIQEPWKPMHVVLRFYSGTRSSSSGKWVSLTCRI